MSQEEKSFLFCTGNVERVKQFLKDNPTWNVNETFGMIENTALHLASSCGHHEIVSILLAHPHINVNQRNVVGFTPLFRACHNRQAEVVKVLLSDPRVDINIPDNDGWTPLWWTSWGGRVEILKWMIVSGRELNLDVKGEVDGKEYTAIEIASTENEIAVVSLLERFLANPERTRHEIRIELGVKDALVADNFAMVIFLCDGLLDITSPVVSTGHMSRENKARKYFSIQVRFPMEIQSIIANRSQESSKDRIRTKDSEPAFKSLAQRLQDAHLH